MRCSPKQKHRLDSVGPGSFPIPCSYRLRNKHRTPCGHSLIQGPRKQLRKTRLQSPTALIATADKCPTIAVFTKPTPICKRLSTVVGHTRFNMVLRISCLDGSFNPASCANPTGFGIGSVPFTFPVKWSDL